MFKYMRNKQKGMAAIGIALTIVVVGMLITHSANNMNFLKGVASRTNESYDAENFNRSAISFFKNIWEDGLVGVDISGASLNSPSIFHTVSAAALDASERTWTIDSGSNTFVLSRCPPFFDVDPASGVLVSRAGSTDAECIGRNYAAVTTLTPVSLSDSRRVMRVEARTQFPDGSNSTLTVALLTVPGPNLIQVCELAIDGDNSISEKELALVAGSASVDLELTFSPYTTNNIEVFVNGVQRAVDAASMASSPLLVPLTFSAPGNYRVEFKTSGSGVPCDPTVEISVDQPPPACKWLTEISPGVPYYEDVDLTVCEIPVRRNGRYTIHSVPGIRFGIAEGTQYTQAEINAMSTGHTRDRRPNRNYCQSADHCRFRVFHSAVPSTVIQSNASTSTCLNVPNGAYQGANARHFFLGMFKVGGGACESRLAIMRSNDGCLPPDSLVKMADGRLKRIDSLSRGDEVWDPTNNRPAKVVMHTTGEEKLPYIVLTTENKSVRMTTLHPVFTAEGMVKAESVKPGDSIKTAQGAFELVTRVDLDHSGIGATVWNIMLERPDSLVPTFIADGVVVGDWVTQQGFAHFADETSSTKAGLLTKRVAEALFYE